MQDEQVLMARARALDQEALAEIHDIYYRPIFRYITLRVGDHEAAEDLTSDVFLRLLKALRDHTAPQRTLRGWLYAVAYRVVQDHYRRGYRRQDVELHDDLPSAAPSPATIVGQRLTWERVQGSLDLLTEEQQDVIALRFGYGMPIREVAQVTGKSEGAVKQLQARAVAALARQLRADSE